MFFLRLWRWLCGWVRFEAEGGAPGRLLALAAREHLPLWNTRRKGTVLSAHCMAADYRRLRPLVRRCGLRMRLKERHGAAFVLRRYHARPGLLAGVAIYTALLIVLSGRIWAVDIRGLSCADEAALRAFLTTQGVAVGQKKAAVSPEQVQLAAIQQLKDISWLAVNLDCCVAEVEIREMNANEVPLSENTPSNLVAARDGLVVAVEITGGEALVKVGDAVAEGGLLASGITATERETLLRRSAGVVLAETSRQLVISVPLTETLPRPADAPFESLDLRLFGWLLPLSDSQADTAGCRVEEGDHRLTLGGISLPLGVRMRRYTPLSDQVVTRTAEEAEALAYERLTAEETEALAGAQITDRTLTATVAGNVLVLTADYRCVENIAREIPIQVDPSPS